MEGKKIAAASEGSNRDFTALDELIGNRRFDLQDDCG